MFLKNKTIILLYSLLLFIVTYGSLANGQSSDSLEQLPRPAINASKINQSPILDGNITNDPAWKSVEPISGFTQIQPNVGDPASQKTEVYMGFTDDAVYIGVIAYDKNPENIMFRAFRRACCSKPPPKIQNSEKIIKFQ